jgi:hypothetical protein
MPGGAVRLKQNVDAPGASIAPLISQIGKPGRAVLVEILKRRD